MTPPCVVCATESPYVVGQLRALTARRGWPIFPAIDAPTALALLGVVAPALVLCDDDLPPHGGRALLREIARLAPDAVRLLIVGAGGLGDDGDACRTLALPGGEHLLEAVLDGVSPAREVPLHARPGELIGSLAEGVAALVARRPPSLRSRGPTWPELELLARMIAERDG